MSSTAAGDVPAVEGSTGLRGFIGLFGGGVGLLRARPALRRSFARWSALGLAFTLGTSAGVAWLHGGGLVPVAALAVAWWLLIEALMVGGAPMLRVPPGMERIDHYGLPNGLTLLRAWSCLPLILVASLSLPGRLSLILWCSCGGPAAALDMVDGLVARRVGPITELGRAIDPAMDAVFFSMAGVGCVLVGILPAWVMALMLVRYLGPLLATPVVLLLRRRPELVHTVWGRRNTAAVSLVMFVCMWVRIAGGPTALVATVLSVALLVPTTVLHFVALGVRAWHAPVVRERRTPG